MELTVFNELCRTLGDQSLPEADRWKSIKYINIAGQASPAFDMQKLISEGRVSFVDTNDNIAGFIIVDGQNSDMGVTGLNESIINCIPLNTIDSVTFMVTETNEDGSDKSLYEIINNIKSYDGKINVFIQFDKSRYYVKKGEQISVPIRFTKNLSSSDYSVTYKDIDGNIIGKPTDVGTYKMCVTCLNRYSGYGEVIIEIQN